MLKADTMAINEYEDKFLSIDKSKAAFRTYFFRSNDFVIQNQLTKKSKAGVIPNDNKAPKVLYFKIIKIEKTKPIIFPTILIKITFLNCERPLLPQPRKCLTQKAVRIKPLLERQPQNHTYRRKFGHSNNQKIQKSVTLKVQKLLKATKKQ